MIYPWYIYIYINIYISIHALYIWAPVKTSDILEQLHQDIDTWYYPETLRNDRGDTKNDGLWYTCLPDFITNIESSGTMRDTQKTMTVSAMSFRGCDRFSPLLIYIYIYIRFKYIYIYIWHICYNILLHCNLFTCFFLIRSTLMAQCHTSCPPCRLMVLPMFQERWL